MYVVTAGKAFNDIDAFGCAIAYAELLRKEGKDAQAVFIGPLNHSVTPLALEQGAAYATNHAPAPEDRLVYVDLSDPTHFAFPNLDASKVVEIYDHHYGFEAYWKTRLGERSHIERVGAAATLIWEEFTKRGFAHGISAASANLLALAILQNTLNFTSSETCARDHAAFKALEAHLAMPEGWRQRYFDECAWGLRAGFDAALRTDTKIVEEFFGDRTLVFSQLEITEDPISFLARHKNAIDTYWSAFVGARCLLNLADIASRSSVLYANDPAWLHDQVQPLFPNVLENEPDQIRVPIHQRKQIMKLFQTQSAP